MLLRQDFGFEGTLLCRIHVKQKDKLYFIKIFILKRQNVEEKFFVLERWLGKSGLERGYGISAFPT